MLLCIYAASAMHPEERFAWSCLSLRGRGPSGLQQRRQVLQYKWFAAGPVLRGIKTVLQVPRYTLGGRHRPAMTVIKEAHLQ